MSTNGMTTGDIARRDRALSTTLALGALLGIFLLSSIPDEGVPTGLAWLLSPIPSHVQNVLHIPLYAGLALLWAWSLTTWRLARRTAIIVAIVIALVYGTLDEFHQMWIPGRYASLSDALLNLLGALAGGWLFARFSKSR